MHKNHEIFVLRSAEIHSILSFNMKHLTLIATVLLFISGGVHAQVDCAGIEGGSALIDDCGDCQQAYIYNFITHSVTFVDVAEDAVAGPNEAVILPDHPGNPYWNGSCTSVPGCTDVTACNFNYLASEDDGTCGMTDDCGDCQVPYCYNPVTHEVDYIGQNDCNNIWVGTAMLSDQAMNPYWNESCTDCAGVVNGSALVDDCGDCHQAYIYNFITHSVTFVDVADEAVAGPNESVILPDNPGNPYWNQACSSVPGCTDVTACNFNYLASEDDGTCGVSDDCGECQIPYCYNPVTHDVAYTSQSECETIWVEGSMLSDPAMNPYWNSSCELLGCTYSNACNFVAIANTDDGSCEWNSCELLGCTYVDAMNFNPNATMDNGTCTFGASSCPADFDQDGAVATNDLLIFLSSFGEDCF